MACTQLRLGLAGLGAGTINALPELAAHPNYRITAAADIRPAALARFVSDFGGEAYDSIEAMCHSRNVDVVHILTPNRFHAQHALAAIEAGKHVICDKPMATTLVDCDAMIQAAERKGVRLLVGHTQSLDPAIRRMASIIGEGEIGRPIMVNSWFYTDWLYRPRDSYELDPSQGEGLVMRQAPVQVDIARMLSGGRAKSVRAVTTALAANRPIEGSYSCFLEFESGLAATLVCSAYAHFDSAELTFGIGLQGSSAAADGHLRSRQLIAGFPTPEDERSYKEATRYGGERSPKDLLKRKPPDRHAFFGLTIASCERGDIRQSPQGLFVYTAEGRSEIPIDPSKRYTTAELDMMYDAWVRDQPLPSHDGPWGKATLEVCLGILESSRSGQTVAMAQQTDYRIQGDARS